ncbi:MAG: hypothetical protein EOP85_21245 [Verrucomicrobiaceae bacterium]|nr:MAG: hypothetical protein EOP85_21245 [Verrucomicrobiaceae bacterium]
MKSVQALYQFLAVDQLPLHGRVKVEILETREGKMKESDTQTTYSLEATAEPKTLLSAHGEKDGRKIQIKAEHDFDVSAKDIFLKLEGTFRLPDQVPLKIDTNLALESGVPFKFAEDHSGDKGIALRVTASAVTTDGMPLQDQVLIQKDGTSVPLELPLRKRFRRHKIAENLWLAIAPIPLSHFIPEHNVDYTGVDGRLPELDCASKPEPLQKEDASGVPKSLMTISISSSPSGST